MTSTAVEFKEGLLRFVPDLRAFALSLCRNTCIADDLVQETLVIAWEKRTTLRELSKLKPWLLSILRREFLKNAKRKFREVEDVDGHYASQRSMDASQPHSAELSDVRRALMQLCREEREALVLICLQKLTYDEAATLCGCPPGTLKSRIHRARRNLLRLLGEGNDTDLCIPNKRHTSTRHMQAKMRSVPIEVIAEQGHPLCSSEEKFSSTKFA